MLERAASILKEGNPVAFPTETVYGLGAPVFSPEAVKRIFELKGRPQDNPLIVHVSSFEQLDLIVEWFPEDLARHFWPGPLTLILPKKSTVPECVSAGLKTIGVRMPAHPLALKLIEGVGQPLAAPSANLSGRPSSTTAQHVLDDFGDQVLVLDGGACVGGLESTVLALNPPLILRPGAVTKEEIEKILGREVDIAKGEAERPRSPGMKYKHYAPRAKVRLIEANEQATPSPKTMILRSIKPEELYALFREADKQGMEEIVICCDHTMKSNTALLNRLIRAAH
ncbi:MAG: threonylcarbamoyl-AMP synthase [Chlamydiales bacterium]|nr:threonylcarbamoyl-AMP synthase [Chlamydiales bacterium]